MPYTAPVKTNVTSATTFVAVRTFGTINIVDENNQFLERAKSFASVEEAALYLPSYSEAYKAVSAAFSVEVKPTSVMVSRRKCNATLTVETPTNGKVYTVRIRETASVFHNISYTASGVDTATSVATAVVALINGITSLAAVVTASAAAGVITIARDGAADFSIDMTNLSGFTIGRVASTESAADTMNAVLAQTREFYAVTTTDRSQTFVTALKSWVNSAEDKYAFFWDTSEATAYQSELLAGSTDWVGVFKLEGNPRSIPFYCQANQLDKYPSIRLFASKTSYQPGDVIYSNVVDLGIEPAKKVDGSLLTKAELYNLETRGINYVEYFMGVTGVRRGKCQATGTANWIDDKVIGPDYIEARVNEGVANLLIRQKSSKLGGFSGYGQIRSAIAGVLDYMVSTQTTARLIRKYNIITPKASEITPTIRASRVATIQVEVWLEGAIDSVVINVTTQY